MGQIAIVDVEGQAHLYTVCWPRKRPAESDHRSDGEDVKAPPYSSSDLHRKRSDLPVVEFFMQPEAGEVVGSMVES